MMAVMFYAVLFAVLLLYVKNVCVLWPIEGYKLLQNVYFFPFHH